MGKSGAQKFEVPYARYIVFPSRRDPQKGLPTALVWLRLRLWVQVRLGQPKYKSTPDNHRPTLSRR